MKQFLTKLHPLFTLALTGILTACGGDGSVGDGGTTTTTYTIGGSVSGLASGSQVILQNNGADTLTLNTNGAFTFPTPIANNGSYAVTVSGQPTGQICTVTSGTSSGSSVTANVSNVSVVCTSTSIRGLWMWDTRSVLASSSQQTLLLNEAQAAGITDLYAYLSANDYTSLASQLQSFIQLMRQNNINVWGLDGSRAYFSDCGGPSGLYDSANALIAYNKNSPANARFIGFQADDEPQDQSGCPTSFHNDYADSELSTTGGGVWQATQAQDREKLMEDWVNTQKTLYQMLSPLGLRVGASMVSWTESYCGSTGCEAVHVTLNGNRNNVSHELMKYLNDYVVMSYNTNPSNAAGRVAVQAQYASSLPEAVRPRVSASIETNTGVGAHISYGDTPGKQSKAVALTDMQTIQSTLAVYPAFGGVSIEDRIGWHALPN